MYPVTILLFMGTLQKYIQELEQDVVLNELNLKASALTLPAKKAKWVSRLMIEKRRLIELNGVKNKKIKDAVEVVRQESPVKLTTSTLERAAEQSEEIKSLNLEIREQENVIDLLERVERTMHSIGFDIKNLIELIKMETT